MTHKIVTWPPKVGPDEVLDLDRWKKVRMSRRKHSVEQIIGKLREAEVRLAQGRTVGKVCREPGISERNSGTSC